MIILNYIHYKNKHFYDTECIKLPRVPVHCKTAIRDPLILWVRLTEFFFLLALQPPLRFVFYSPLVGFSLLAYEVS